MRNTERRRVEAQLGERGEQLLRWRGGEQRGEERVFLRARDIHVVSLDQITLAVEIGPQLYARNSGRRLDGEYAFGRHAIPI